MSDQYLKFFNSNDIRGRADEGMDEAFFERLGKSLVTYLGAKKIVVGHDIRVDSQVFKMAFIKGAASLGCQVVDIGLAPTELIYFATGSDISLDGGVVITASHNPAGWSGAKMVGKQAEVICLSSGMEEVKQIFENNVFEEKQAGQITSKDLFADYKQAIWSVLKGIKVPKLKVVVDAGNGIGGWMFEKLFGELEMEVVKMYFDMDGSFPNHVANPLMEENVAEIKEKVVEMGADLGIAIDADGDRVFFIDKKGRNPCGIYLGRVLVEQILQGRKGVVLHDHKVCLPIRQKILSLGCQPEACKTGHAYFKQKMKQSSAWFGVEMSGHLFYRDFFGCDSAGVTMAWMLRSISQGLNLTGEMDFVYANFPILGEVNFKVEDATKTMEAISQEYGGQAEKTDYVDGVSMEFLDWRFNLRKSNNEPLLRLNMEATDKNLIIENFLKLKQKIGGTMINQPGLEELKLLVN